MLIDFTGIKQLLSTSTTIAVVGLSPKEARASNQVARYLIEAGYTVIPVNPGQERVLGLCCFPDLVSIPGPVDIVDVFRRSSEVEPIVDEAIRIGARAIWLQEGVVNQAAAQKARNAGLLVVMDRCIKSDHLSLAGTPPDRPAQLRQSP